MQGYSKDIYCTINSVFLVLFVGCKWTLTIAMACYIAFMAAHFYATWELFIPAAVILGLGAAPLWTAKCTYLNIVCTSVYLPKHCMYRSQCTYLNIVCFIWSLKCMYQISQNVLLT